MSQLEASGQHGRRDMAVFPQACAKTNTQPCFKRMPIHLPANTNARTSRLRLCRLHCMPSYVKAYSVYTVECSWAAESNLSGKNSFLLNRYNQYLHVIPILKMSKLKRASSALSGSEAKKRKQKQREDPVKRQLEREHDRLRHQLDSRQQSRPDSEERQIRRQEHDAAVH